ncbi:MAG: 50S ribosomal protein L25 [Kiritimatiellales bacterium]|nr:50S ribosomal protein L25 [Kiritimatiellota bacterium]MBL7011772.1 50S ribosomal protein L25 [Kiritimatiellales bacterium]
MDAKLIVTSRDKKGSANVRRMRRAGLIPGVIYGEGGEAREVSLPQHEFKLMLHHHAGEQMMVAIEIDGKNESVLLKDVQHAALSSDILHVDFQKVSLTKKLKVQIAIELTGEAEGVKKDGGVLDHTLYSVEVECLPDDILEKIEVDVSSLKMGDVLTVKDIELDTSKYEILLDGDTAVASVLAPRVAVEGEEGEEGAEGASAEPEVITEKKEEGAE